jgi:hypothetical protein
VRSCLGLLIHLSNCVLRVMVRSTI